MLPAMQLACSFDMHKLLPIHMIRTAILLHAAENTQFVAVSTEPGMLGNSVKERKKK